jgi:hypothetical protein
MSDSSSGHLQVGKAPPLVDARDSNARARRSILNITIPELGTSAVRASGQACLNSIMDQNLAYRESRHGVWIRYRENPFETRLLSFPEEPLWKLS